jgi:hypothetical protein
MKSEAAFSKYFCDTVRRYKKCLVQRLEITTGAGVPDLVVIHDYKTHWIELKWNTKHIRPEQYVWGKKALSNSVTVNYLVGTEKTIELYTITQAIQMTRSFKLTDRVTSFDRNMSGIDELVDNLF